MKSAYQERKEARKNWPVNAVSATSEDVVTFAKTTSSSERLAMMWQLSRDAWVMTGNKLPEYQRTNMPGKLVNSDEL